MQLSSKEAICIFEYNGRAYVFPAYLYVMKPTTEHIYLHSHSKENLHCFIVKLVEEV